MSNELKIFGGTANTALTNEICEYLDCEVGKSSVTRFSDGEIYFQILENVRGADVFILQPTCPPVDSNLIELFLMIDAFKRASAKRITTVLPYFGYARQDRKDKPRVPISSKVVSDLIVTSGADRLLIGSSSGYATGLSTTLPARHTNGTEESCVATSSRNWGERRWSSSLHRTFSATTAEGITYSLDGMDSDILSRLTTKYGPLVLIPYPVITVDMGQYLERAKDPTDMERIWYDYVAELAREAQADPNHEATVVAIGIHPFVFGTPSGAAALRRVLESFKSQDAVWVTDVDAMLDAAGVKPPSVATNKPAPP